MSQLELSVDERAADIREARRAHLATVRYQHPTAELEAYKQAYGLRGYKEAAKEIGCGRRPFEDGSEMVVSSSKAA